MRYLSILFLSFYLLTVTDIGQFVKLPLLVKHYNQHEKCLPGLSITGFIQMHYWGEDGNDSDNQEDQQLPFKHPHASTTLAHSFIEPSTFSFNTPIKCMSLNSHFYSQSYIPSSIPETPFRPPIS